MKKNALSVPNILTYIRLALVPLLIYSYLTYYESMPLLSASIFFAGIFTDFLDGYIARKFNLISDIGKVLDPLADKIFVISMLVCFAIKSTGIIMWSLLVVYFIKEFFMVSAGTLLYRRKFVVSAKPIGKLAAFVLNIGLLSYFFVPFADIIRTIASTILVTGMGLSIASTVYYIISVYRATGGKLPPKTNKGDKAPNEDNL